MIAQLKLKKSKNKRQLVFLLDAMSKTTVIIVTGLTLEIFQYLHEQYIISLDGFIAWEESEKEPEGKGIVYYNYFSLGSRKNIKLLKPYCMQGDKICKLR